MFHWVIRILFLIIACGSGVLMFILKYNVIKKEETLQELHEQIRRDSREIYMLQVDWATANDPRLLRTFVEEQTKFKTIHATQIIDAESLPEKPAPIPLNPPNFKDAEDEE
jgi:hypothetical protein